MWQLHFWALSMTVFQGFRRLSNAPAPGIVTLFVTHPETTFVTTITRPTGLVSMSKNFSLVFCEQSRALNEKSPASRRTHPNFDLLFHAASLPGKQPRVNGQLKTTEDN
jgi:hypothetical protein